MVMVTTIGYLERTAASVDDKRSIDGDDVLKGDEVGEVARISCMVMDAPLTLWWNHVCAIFLEQ